MVLPAAEKRACNLPAPQMGRATYPTSRQVANCALCDVMNVRDNPSACEAGRGVSDPPASQLISLIMII